MRAKNTINYTEFIAAAVHTQNDLVVQNLWWMFNEFDCDKDGTINPKDMQQAFERMGQPTSEEEVEEILHDHNEKYHNG